MMLGIDSYWLVSETLLVITFLAFIFTQILMPGREKVRSGVRKLPSWVPFALILMIITSLSMGVIAVALVEKFIVILVTDIILLTALLLSLIDYYRTRSLVRKLYADGQPTPETGYPVGGPQGDQYNVPPPTATSYYAPRAPAGTMTVECPGCHAHFQIPEGSHQITCPYCGLSGTM